MRRFTQPEILGSRYRSPEDDALRVPRHPRPERRLQNKTGTKIRIGAVDYGDGKVCAIHGAGRTFRNVMFDSDPGNLDAPGRAGRRGISDLRIPLRVARSRLTTEGPGRMSRAPVGIERLSEGEPLQPTTRAVAIRSRGPIRPARARSEFIDMCEGCTRSAHGAGCLPRVDRVLTLTPACPRCRTATARWRNLRDRARRIHAVHRRALMPPNPHKLEVADEEICYCRDARRRSRSPRHGSASGGAGAHRRHADDGRGIPPHGHDERCVRDPVEPSGP